MLIVFSSLPGTGKTTIAKDLAAQTDAVYLRIDTIEQEFETPARLQETLGAVAIGSLMSLPGIIFF